MRRKAHIIICITLHVLFLLLHVVLLVLAILLKESPPILNVSSNVFEAAVAVVAQGFTILYCAILVTTTQQLALQDIFYRRQTLSAIHDKSSAWLGLGSSVFAVLRQRSLTTDLIGVVATLFYLLSICVIHTAFPGIFTVTSNIRFVPQTITTETTTNQSVSVLAYQDFGISQVNSEVYNIINDNDDAPFPINPGLFGLEHNAIYDTFPAGASDNSRKSTSVNITSLKTDCTYISGQSLHEPSSASTDIVIKLALLPMPPNTLQISSYLDMPNTIFLASTYPVFDADDFLPPVIRIDTPQEVQNGNSNTTSCLAVAESVPVQLMACSIGVHNGSATVYYSDEAPQSTSVEVHAGPATVSSFPDFSALWREWSAPEIQPGADDPIIDVIRKFVSRCPRKVPVKLSSSSTNSTELGGADVGSPPYVPSILENFVWLDLVNTRLNESSSLCPCTTKIQSTLAGLNFSLARVFAALLWSLNNQTADDDHKLHGLSTITSSPFNTESNIGSCINLNPVLIGASFAASGVALFTCIFIMYRSRGFRAQSEVPFVDTSGVLPVVWLLGSESRLADIEEPDIDALRKAGMFEFDSDIVRRFNSTINIGARKEKGYEGIALNDQGDK